MDTLLRSKSCSDPLLGVLPRWSHSVLALFPFLILLLSLAHRKVVQMVLPTKFRREIKGKKRSCNRVEIRASLTVSVPWVPEKTLLKSAKCFEILVSAAGFEPATHALKEYSTIDSRRGKSEHRARDAPVFMRVRIEITLLLQLLYYSC